MNISQEFRDRVSVTDHGVVDQLDPETGKVYQAYVTAYFVVDHDGLEHSLVLASSPLIAGLPDAYDALLDIWAFTAFWPRLGSCHEAGLVYRDLR